MTYVADTAFPRPRRGMADPPTPTPPPPPNRHVLGCSIKAALFVTAQASAAVSTAFLPSKPASTLLDEVDALLSELGILALDYRRLLDRRSSKDAIAAFHASQFGGREGLLAWIARHVQSIETTRNEAAARAYASATALAAAATTASSLCAFLGVRMASPSLGRAPCSWSDCISGLLFFSVTTIAGEDSDAASALGLLSSAFADLADLPSILYSLTVKLNPSFSEDDYSVGGSRTLAPLARERTRAGAHVAYVRVLH